MALSNASLTRTQKVRVAARDGAKEAKQPTGETEGASVNETKDNNEYLDLVKQDDEAMEQQTKEVAADTERIESARKQVYKDQVEMWGVYKYGLQHVKELTDLSAAPDAILPGNFPE